MLHLERSVVAEDVWKAIHLIWEVCVCVWPSFPDEYILLHLPLDLSAVNTSTPSTGDGSGALTRVQSVGTWTCMLKWERGTGDRTKTGKKVIRVQVRTRDRPQSERTVGRGRGSFEKRACRDTGGIIERVCVCSPSDVI